MAKGNRPSTSSILYGAIVDAYRAKHGDTSGLESVKVNVQGPDDTYTSFKTTFRALGQSTRGRLRINFDQSGLSSDGNTYSAVLSRYQPSSDGREYLRRMRKKAK